MMDGGRSRMSGRMQVFVLAVAVVTLGGPAVDAQQAGREMSNPENVMSDFLNELANRCRSLAGEQAASDLENIPTTLGNCVNIPQLSAEIEQEGSDWRKVIQVICGKKDRLQTCAKDSLQILKRCLRPEEKKFAETINQISEATDDFFCNNIDDILSTLASEDEMKCVIYLGGKAPECGVLMIGTNGDGQQPEDLLKYFSDKEKMCRETKEELQCIADRSDKCKDSGALRLLNSYIHEVMDAVSCPNSGRGGAAGLLALGTAPTTVVVPLAMCLAAPRVLHLQ